MVFPIGDDDSARRTVPFVTYLLIIINVVVFLLELQRGEAFIREWAFIPAEFWANPSAEAVTPLTAMFMHGGWLHLFGNMLYLYVFGDNIEDDFGHLPFLIFYLIVGLAATFAQMIFMQDSNLPNLGASGAIAGVLGAYILLFPKGRVRLLTRGGVIAVPAIVALGFWILLQFISLGGEMTVADSAQRGGVAYMAHIGGFVAGIVLAFLFRERKRAVSG
jgi:membrane associated rhomboid family serine protease